MNRSLQIRTGLCLVIVLFSVYLLWPTYKATTISKAERERAETDPALKAEIAAVDAKAIRRGLDLQGGMYLVLEIDTEGMTADQAHDARARVLEIITNRVNQFGVSEPVIQAIGDRRIIVQLPGLQDAERAKGLIGSTARLEFRLLQSPEVVQAAVAKLDETFRKVTVPDSTASAAASEAIETAAADGDTAAGPYAELPDPDAADLAEDPALDEQRARNPFSSYLIPTPWPYFMVQEKDVARIEAMLAAPEAKVLGRDIEFQLGMDVEPLQDGTMGRFLYPVESTVALAGDRLTNARERPDPDTPANWTVSFEIDRKGAHQFAKVTGDNVGEFLAISLDGRVKSAPRINSRIPGGSGVIEGTFTAAQAADLALLLRAGALPADVRIAEERTVGPSLGSDSIRQGLRAAMIGAIVVVIFMAIYYRFCGLIADIALACNILILMAVLAQFGLVLTLPGLAGVALTMGMAVDANVLINERIREELRKAKTVRAAVQTGYQNAMRTILDANVTTLIVGLVLWNFGTGPILGFAVTMSIGIVTSVFAALVLARVIIEWATRDPAKQTLSI
ncbi:MAG TPA: protein translocase subunit SecD [Candidatus Krumholzibacteria bacterium]|nr:protein translocase subunit SecD [Candidatus Krumholzibacteria bacterium]HPD72333.1 protein translocase subunit SecD [Candidatus Krumholzibacteria bacterium]HRY40735.1 protein translocase subunit SecD [Candidatus Krumholzibacteria bacterium]